MIKAIPKRTFLLRQEEVNGKTKDVLAKKGEKVDLSEKEAVKFWGSLDISEADKKKLLAYSKQNKVGRIV